MANYAHANPTVDRVFVALSVWLGVTATTIGRLEGKREGKRNRARHCSTAEYNLFPCKSAGVCRCEKPRLYQARALSTYYNSLLLPKHSLIVIPTVRLSLLLAISTETALPARLLFAHASMRNPGIVLSNGRCPASVLQLLRLLQNIGSEQPHPAFYTELLTLACLSGLIKYPRRTWFYRSVANEGQFWRPVKYI